MLKSKEQFRAVEPAALLIKPLLTLQVMEELSTIHEATADARSLNPVPHSMGSTLTPIPNIASAQTGN